LNDAVNIAAKIPPAKYGSIEVQPVRQIAVPNYQFVTGAQHA
jgi:hypothetical protein